jgi:aminomethyltransferase
MEAQYSALCYDNGTVVDDILVYCLGEGHYKLVVNASNIDKDFSWMAEHKPKDVELRNASAELCILSLQGPRALEVARSVMASDPTAIGSYKAGRGKVAGVETLFSRTGYTGEDGFEFYPENRHAVDLWKRLMEAGVAHGIQAVGLGARDTLRLEAGLSLYGHELSDKTNLIEAGLSWITDFSKGDFIGRAALEAKVKAGVARKIVGLELQELAIPREGCIVRAEGSEVGVVTSGTMSPTLAKGIALAYVKADLAKTGNMVEVVVRDAGKQAKVVGRYFYKRSSSGAPRSKG